jgi:hypothetical protein
MVFVPIVFHSRFFIFRSSSHLFSCHENFQKANCPQFMSQKFSVSQTVVISCLRNFQKANCRHFMSQKFSVSQTVVILCLRNFQKVKWSSFYVSEIFCKSNSRHFMLQKFSVSQSAHNLQSSCLFFSLISQQSLLLIYNLL